MTDAWARGAVHLGVFASDAAGSLSTDASPAPPFESASFAVAASELCTQHPGFPHQKYYALVMREPVDKREATYYVLKGQVQFPSALIANSP